MKVFNQTPTRIYPPLNDYPKPNGSVDIYPVLQTTLVDSLAPNASFQDDEGNNLSEQDIIDSYLKTSQSSRDVDAESFMQSYLAQCVVNYAVKPGDICQEMFVTQAATIHKLSRPAPDVIYTIDSDVLVSLKAWMADKSEINTDLVLASLAYTFTPKVFGVLVEDDKDFDDLKTQVMSLHTPLRPLLSADVNSKFDQFAALDSTQILQALILRGSDDDDDDEYSFARTLSYLVTQVLRSSNAQPLPFRLDEWVHPRIMVFVNARAHLQAKTKDIMDEWMAINHFTAHPLRLVSKQNLVNAAEMTRSQKRLATLHNDMLKNQDSDILVTKSRTFSTSRPSLQSMYARLLKVINAASMVTLSQNAVAHRKATFAKMNRRNPDDFNLMGRHLKIKYHPDLHIYLDTSGSISEQNYADGIKIVISLARKLGVNVYLNSFSHYISTQTLIKIKNRSLRQIYSQVMRIPKVTGGTDYAQVWRYINASSKRRKEISLMFTDFEYSAPNERFEHPKNLYYLPISHSDWDDIRRSMTGFAHSMEITDPHIYKQILA